MLAIVLLTSLLLAVQLGILLLNSLTAPRVSQRLVAAPPPQGPLVSLLIPVRNEANQVNETLRWVSQLNYPRLEVLFLDDNSTDNTRQILGAALEQLPFARLLDGAPLPQGWLGKNFSCHQLSRAASGDLLLFVDADVTLREDAVTALVTLKLRSGTAAITVFPRQECRTLGEQVVVPLMDLLLFTLLPIITVRRFRSPRLVAATGQCFLFDQSTYHAIGGHAAVQNEILEDMALARNLKSHGYPLLIAWGDGAISCRMYTSLSESIQGFEKNLFASLGGRVLPFCGAVLVLLWINLAPLVLLAFDLRALVPIILLAAIRLLHGLIFGYGGALMLALHLPSWVMFGRIAVGSLVKTKKRRLTWRGRNLGQGS